MAGSINVGEPMLAVKGKPSREMRSDWTERQSIRWAEKRRARRSLSVRQRRPASWLNRMSGLKAR